MKKIFQLFNAFMISAISTLVLLIISFLFMLFSSKKDGYRTTFFDAIFFRSTTNSKGAVSINFGVQNYEPIIWTLVAIFGFTLLTMYFYNQLLLRRKRLLMLNDENKN